MKGLLFAFCLAAVPAAEAIAAPGFSWFHTRPKPVILDNNPPPSSTEQTRVRYRGTAVYPGSGRLYFEDQRDKSEHSRMSTALSRSWESGTTSAKPNTARSRTK